jgi:hypothetical protein
MTNRHRKIKASRIWESSPTIFARRGLVPADANLIGPSAPPNAKEIYEENLKAVNLLLQRTIKDYTRKLKDVNILLKRAEKREAKRAADDAKAVMCITCGRYLAVKDGLIP